MAQTERKGTRRRIGRVAATTIALPLLALLGPPADATGVALPEGAGTHRIQDRDSKAYLVPKGKDEIVGKKLTGGWLWDLTPTNNAVPFTGEFLIQSHGDARSCAQRDGHHHKTKFASCDSTKPAQRWIIKRTADYYTITNVATGFRIFNHVDLIVP